MHRICINWNPRNVKRTELLTLHLEQLDQRLKARELILAELQRFDAAFLLQSMCHLLQIIIFQTTIHEIELMDLAVSLEPRQDVAQSLFACKPAERELHWLLLIDLPHYLSYLLDKITLSLLKFENLILKLHL